MSVGVADNYIQVSMTDFVVDFVGGLFEIIIFVAIR